MWGAESEGGRRQGAELGGGFGGGGGKGSLGKVAPSGGGGSVGWEAATHVDLINGGTWIAPCAPATCAKSQGLAGRWPEAEQAWRGASSRGVGVSRATAARNRWWDPCSGVQTATLAACGVGSLGAPEALFLLRPWILGPALGWSRWQ